MSEEIKTETINKYLITLFILCALLIGYVLGIFTSYQIYKWRIGEAVKSSTFIFNDRIYNLNEKK